jgi:16S rRNA (guanine(527)-N(7))-methyltransferase RsmG
MQVREQSSIPRQSVSESENVSPETIGRLRNYVALLLRWNATINLVGRGDSDLVWTRHVADSLRLQSLVPLGTDAATDLGSGAGLPGLVLAVVTGIPFALIEADRRKAAFLLEAARVTAAPVTVHCARIEAAQLPPAPLLTARALAPLPRLLDYAHRLLAPGGACLFPKGAGADAEIAAARHQGWRFTVEKHDDPAAPDSTVLRVSDLARD